MFDTVRKWLKFKFFLDYWIGGSDDETEDNWIWVTSQRIINITDWGNQIMQCRLNIVWCYGVVLTTNGLTTIVTTSIDTYAKVNN